MDDLQAMNTDVINEQVSISDAPISQDSPVQSDKSVASSFIYVYADAC